MLLARASWLDRALAVREVLALVLLRGRVAVRPDRVAERDPRRGEAERPDRVELGVALATLADLHECPVVCDGLVVEASRAQEVLVAVEASARPAAEGRAATGVRRRAVELRDEHPVRRGRRAVVLHDAVPGRQDEGRARARVLDDGARADVVTAVEAEQRAANEAIHVIGRAVSGVRVRRPGHGASAATTAGPSRRLEPRRATDEVARLRVPDPFRGPVGEDPRVLAGRGARPLCRSGWRPPPIRAAARGAGWGPERARDACACSRSSYGGGTTSAEVAQGCTIRQRDGTQPDRPAPHSPALPSRDEDRTRVADGRLGRPRSVGVAADQEARTARGGGRHRQPVGLRPPHLPHAGRGGGRDPRGSDPAHGGRHGRRIARSSARSSLAPASGRLRSWPRWPRPSTRLRTAA